MDQPESLDQALRRRLNDHYDWEDNERAIAALLAVLDLHSATDFGLKDCGPCCSECSNSEESADWPCSTVKAIAEKVLLQWHDDLDGEVRPRWNSRA